MKGSEDMTCRERLQQEHPERVHKSFHGGCYGCPNEYGYVQFDGCLGDGDYSDCAECWNREIPEKEGADQ